MRARSASSTELRPVTVSVSSAALERGVRLTLACRGLGLPPAATNRSCAAFRLPATCQARSSAFGVGPLPSSALRLWPPVPLVAPFFLLLPAPGRPGLAIDQAPM